jgi:hypothetical protein
MAVLIALAIGAGKNHSTMATPRDGMLVSLAIMEHGTIKLDEYHSVQRCTYPLIPHSWHIYRFLLLGTSLWPALASSGDLFVASWADVIVAGVVSIDFQEFPMFADVAGIVYNLRQAGMDVCVIRRASAHIFTDNASCKTGPAGFVVVNDTQCPDDVCWYKAPPLAVIKLSHRVFPRLELTR